MKLQEVISTSDLAFDIKSYKKMNNNENFRNKQKFTNICNKISLIIEKKHEILKISE